jgi:branched-chain amino acid transport system substrate-binding protein
VYGQAVRDGLNLAFELAGEGVARLVVLDTRSSGEGTLGAFRTLARRRSVLAAVGPCTSTHARAAVTVAEGEGLPMILPTATAFDLTKGRRYAFRTCFTDPLQGAAMAIFARRSLKLRSASMIVVPGEDYSLSLAEAFEKAFRSMGGEVVFRADFGEDLDPGPPAASLAKVSPAPEAVFIPAYIEESARFMREARRLGFKGLFLGGDGWHSGALIEIGKEAVTGARFTTHFIADDPDPATKRFVASFDKSRGRCPGSFEALGYDAGLAALHALRKAGPRGREGIRGALAAIENLPGSTGVITIDESGNPVKNAIVARVDDGGFAFVKRIRFTPGIR